MSRPTAPRSRSVLRALVALATTAMIAVGAAAGCGTDNAVVGGSCVVPFVACGQQCADLANDPQNCGGCGRACLAGQVCAHGACSAGADGTAGDATDADNGEGGPPEEGGHDRDGGDAADVVTIDVVSSEAGDVVSSEAGDVVLSDVSLSDAADACVPPFNTPQHCGDCFTVCTAPNSACLPVDGGFACGPPCPPPQIFCNNACTDPNTDEFNCGRCNNFCPSFICSGGQCVGAQAGDVVLVGHDYNTNIPPTVPQARVLTNAVFNRQRQTIRVLGYQRYADTTSLANVNGILQAFATANGRGLALTQTSNDGDIPGTLTTTSYDVLLVYDQTTAPTSPATLGPLGTSWASTLTTFTKAGGIVVVLDGATEADMPAFVTNAGLLNLTAQTQLATTVQVTNIAPGDTVGTGVASPYRVTAHSSRFACDPPSALVTYVIFDQPDNQPVVVHRIVN